MSPAGQKRNIQQGSVLEIDRSTALRLLFGWAKPRNVIFCNPCARTRFPKFPPPVWPLTDAEIAAAARAADTPQPRLCVVLAAIHHVDKVHIPVVTNVDECDHQDTICPGCVPLWHTSTSSPKPCLGAIRRRT